ncbi:N-alpha-acetyltransferase 80 [Cloeon dipterum]|uniref:N-alpha-acetyltransferase 80 n=1 Tax=Cloeon dipterum TaxID=197152 RepID=UPI0032201C95
MQQDFEGLILHENPHLIDQCCELINSEWPRSHTARRRNLECSCDNLPTCLILVQKNIKNPRVVGHSKISRIPSIQHGAFIESVVIDKNMRGKGLGRILMHQTEDYMKSIGLKEAYLSTYDQQGFYTKLGYSFCERVCIYGSSISLRPPLTDKVPSIEEKRVKSMESQNCTLSLFVPPPPPPLPVLFNASKVPNSSINVPQTIIANGHPKKDFMKKYLH